MSGILERVDVDGFKPIFRYYDDISCETGVVTRFWVTPSQKEFKARLKSDFLSNKMTAKQAREARSISVPHKTITVDGLCDYFVESLAKNGFKPEKE